MAHIVLYMWSCDQSLGAVFKSVKNDVKKMYLFYFHIKGQNGLAQGTEILKFCMLWIFEKCNFQSKLR